MLLLGCVGYSIRMKKPAPESQYKEGNFKKLAASLAKKGTRDPNALAAWIERRKYGAKGWAHIQAKGRKAAAAKK
jgi:hypothetical protein